MEEEEAEDVKRCEAMVSAFDDLVQKGLPLEFEFTNIKPEVCDTFIKRATAVGFKLVKDKTEGTVRVIHFRYD